jgi:Rrf2 family protein
VIFSKPCQYAILAMTYLAEQKAGHLNSIREISERAEIPMPFLSKIITGLSRSGLVTARRGPKGGVMLARPPGEVSVGDIVEAVDGSLDDGRCQLGFPECDDSDPCPVHDSWKQVREKLDRTLHGKTLNDLVRARKKGKTKRARPKAKTGS